jgi:hypothetical protein
MSNSTFDFNVFIKETKDVLVSPKAYFASMKTTGGIAEPLIKALLYGLVAGVLKFIWSIVGLGVTTGALFGGAVGIMLLVWSIIGAVIALFIGAVIILIISAICKGSTDFESNVRVSASVMVVMPVGALLAFITGLNFTAGAIIGLVVNIFALYLIYHALVESLKGNAGTAKIVTYILIALFVLFMLLGFGARKKASNFMNDFKNQDFQELLDEAQKNQ